MEPVSNTAGTAPEAAAKKSEELERRTIWSKKWILAARVSRLGNTGDYIKFDVAGFSYFLIKDKDNDVEGYLNVCWHRVYPIVTKPKSSARILACKYHGILFLFRRFDLLK
ncbi:unnamed protein product [Clonostachys chloroleuca]|uniref:Rieske domain-containing protein n=1 Tax=Clonostachys chloroleuca TaxID=1926264 RepID=A0AA35Q5B8_9HYPO|nr:unnamed protein product [Clonostachys chloroleuca]